MGNDTARRELERLFGKICFIEKLGIRYIPPKERKKIKGYTKYDDVLTYHHIFERQYGGKATVENGAIIRGYNHRWLHSLPEHEKQLINQALQEYKISVLRARANGIEIGAEDLVDIQDLLEVVHMTTIVMEDRNKIRKKQKFNRAKEKRKTQQMIDEALYGEYEDDER